MKQRLLLFSFLLLSATVMAQPPVSWTSGQILQGIKKLKVLGSVLYVAAHPDDENTRLITYLANEKLYRTGYLSLTRGDGGQNLIGDEQGIELGLIRTQELLAARRIDGGEQFFSSAYDFGFSKSPGETFTKWDREKVLGDVVWVIRNFQPDVIITRFPTTGEGGHGHHTASAMLANEAFTAAADPKRYPEQLKYVQPWQAKRILWNTFNFGGNNTTSNDQFTIDAGGYNPLLGRGYGEIAALSRSQHKSQGFGSAATRGQMMEFFKTTGGTAPQQDLMDEVNTGWTRIGAGGSDFQKMADELSRNFDANHPESSVPALVALYQALKNQPQQYWMKRKMAELQQLVAQCSGLFMDAFTSQPFAVQTDSIKINFVVNNRLGAPARLKQLVIDGSVTPLDEPLEKNRNFTRQKELPVSAKKDITQPYWLKEKMDEGHFHISDQQMVGVPDVEPAFTAVFTINIAGTDFSFDYPVKYRNTDPVKGEIYQPLYVIPRASLTTAPQVLIFDKKVKQDKKVAVALHGNKPLSGDISVGITGAGSGAPAKENIALEKGTSKTYNFTVSNAHGLPEESVISGYANQKNKGDTAGYYLAMRAIDYDHIPAIKYFYPDFVKALNIDLKIAGRRIGYIPGAGDKVAEILEQLGYQVTTLNASALSSLDLSQFDAIITGVRAYNTNEWMNDYYDKLMKYVKDGGNFIVQYNTSNNIGPVKARIGPYNFDISRSRITNEEANVQFIDPTHPVFNFPNKITEKDFDNWIQERSIYHASNWDNNLKPLISMADPDESPNNGSLIVGKYGKGYFTYTGLVFFRQLPAAVPGAFRLMANLIALNQKPAVATVTKPQNNKSR